MNTRGMVVLAAMLCACAGSAQVHSVHFFGDYSASLTQRLAIKSATAPGIGAEIRFTIFDSFLLTVGGGYQHYAISQDSALERWNWRFWNERYRGIVRDNLASDTSLSASFNPDQRMEAYPILLGISAEFEPMTDLQIRPSLGGGVVFFSRKLYLEETWQKRFASLGYTFQYSYYNFSNKKEGNPLVLFGGLDVAYRLTRLLMIEARVRYLSYLKTEGSYGFENFPIADAITFSAGISFVY